MIFKKYCYRYFTVAWSRFKAQLEHKQRQSLEAQVKQQLFAEQLPAKSIDGILQSIPGAFVGKIRAAQLGATWTRTEECIEGQGKRGTEDTQRHEDSNQATEESHAEEGGQCAEDKHSTSEHTESSHAGVFKDTEGDSLEPKSTCQVPTLQRGAQRSPNHFLKIVQFFFFFFLL